MPNKKVRSVDRAVVELLAEVEYHQSNEKETQISAEELSDTWSNSSVDD